MFTSASDSSFQKWKFLSLLRKPQAKKAGSMDDTNAPNLNLVGIGTISAPMAFDSSVGAAALLGGSYGTILPAPSGTWSEQDTIIATSNDSKFTSSPTGYEYDSASRVLTSNYSVTVTPHSYFGFDSSLLETTATHEVVDGLFSSKETDTAIVTSYNFVSKTSGDIFVSSGGSSLTDDSLQVKAPGLSLTSDTTVATSQDQWSDFNPITGAESTGSNYSYNATTSATTIFGSIYESWYSTDEIAESSTTVSTPTGSSIMSTFDASAFSILTVIQPGHSETDIHQSTFHETSTLLAGSGGGTPPVPYEGTKG